MKTKHRHSCPASSFPVSFFPDFHLFSVPRQIMVMVLALLQAHRGNKSMQRASRKRKPTTAFQFPVFHFPVFQFPPINQGWWWSYLGKPTERAQHIQRTSRQLNTITVFQFPIFQFPVFQFSTITQACWWWSYFGKPTETKQHIQRT